MEEPHRHDRLPPVGADVEEHRVLGGREEFQCAEILVEGLPEPGPVQELRRILQVHARGEVSLRGAKEFLYLWMD